MRPERAGRDFVEEAGGHLMMLPLPLLLLDAAALSLLLVTDFCFVTLLFLRSPLLPTFIGEMSDVIVPIACLLLRKMRLQLSC